MLIQYSVENYKSIKEEISINFRADSKAKDTGWIIDNENKKQLMYKAIGLIGPNASGKSNIIDSFMFALNFIIGTISRKEISMINIESFQFDEEFSRKPSFFEFIFFWQGVKYVYGFSVNASEVIEEYLLAYYTAKPKTIFDRTEGQKYDFKGNDVRTQRELSGKTNNNRLYMPVAAEWGYQPLKVVYEWFQFITRQYGSYDVSAMIGEIIAHPQRKQMLIQELQRADFNIVDIYAEKEKRDKRALDFVERIFKEVFGEMKEISFPEEELVVRLVHKNVHGNKFDISLNQDSAGTSEIVQNIAELLYISRQGGFILEDELGRAYHTKLTQHFLEMIKSTTENEGNVQILFSSHDTKILNMMNPDQIYLVDKDEEGATYVKLLSDYLIREHDNIELGYLKGRYGSIPYMKG